MFLKENQKLKEYTNKIGSVSHLVLLKTKNHKRSLKKIKKVVQDCINTNLEIKNYRKNLV
jgi:hypothetical protein